MTEQAITQQAFAKMIKVSQPRISAMIKSGIISKSSLQKKGKRFLILAKSAKDDIKKNRDPRTIPANEKGADVGDDEMLQIINEAGIGKVTNLNQVRLLGEQYKTGLLKLKYESEQGQLVQRDQVEKLAFAAGHQFKQSALSMVERVTPIVAAESDSHEVKMILMSEINAMLQQISDAFAKIAERG